MSAVGKTSLSEAAVAAWHR